VTAHIRAALTPAIHGIGIAILPEQVVAEPLKAGLVERVLPEWSGAKNILHLNSVILKSLSATSPSDSAPALLPGQGKPACP